jgi:guanylate kinase
MASERGKVIVISGPSGVGKSTIVREVINRTGATLSVSATTRAPRTGETDGVDYHFVTPERFAEMIRRGELLEWAEVFGNRYGTPAGAVEHAVGRGQTVILEIDVQGGLQVAKLMPQATFVLVEPPDDASLAARLKGRATDGAEVIARRLAKARDELRIAADSGVYNRRIINDDLETAIRAVCAIVQSRAGEQVK